MLRRLKNRYVRRHSERMDRVLLDKIEQVLKNEKPPDTQNSEANFERLQALFPSNRGDSYKYDDFSLYERASHRALQILQLPGMADPGKKILDIGAGDGVLGAILQNYGHSVVLTDMEDWRSRVGRTVQFHTADITTGLPFDEAAFDLVVSYNSFEHFPDPSKAFAEALRVTKPGGLLYFEFCPLFCSPWGLHAYRSLYMPYSQFLLSENFINGRLAKLGINDLGSKRSELQFLNRWKSSKFDLLWHNSNATVIRSVWFEDNEHLDIVIRFPDAFRGRELTIVDLVRSGNSVVLKRNEG
jgi:ubiquinone/menaquinone biosynthesis C-methylase UbiE